MKYHGKGKGARASKSAKEVIKKQEKKGNIITLEKTDITPSTSSRQAYKDEYARMSTDAVDGVEGHRSIKNYNEKQSPGYQYFMDDGF